MFEYKAGDYFGEIALIQNTVRQASIKTTKDLLQEASEEYLLSKPTLINEVLTSVRDGTISPFNALTELNFITSDYACFICEQLFEMNAFVEDVKNDLLIIEKQPELSELLFLLKSFENPDKLAVFKYVLNSGLRFCNQYLNLTQPDDFLIIQDVYILKVMADPELNIFILAKHETFNEGIPFSLNMNIFDFFNSCNANDPSFFLIEKLLMSERKNRKKIITFCFESYGMEVMLNTPVRVFLLQKMLSEDYANSYQFLEFTEMPLKYTTKPINIKRRGDMPDETMFEI